MTLTNNNTTDNGANNEENVESNTNNNSNNSGELILDQNALQNNMANAMDYVVRRIKELLFK